MSGTDKRWSLEGLAVGPGLQSPQITPLTLRLMFNNAIPGMCPSTGKGENEGTKKKEHRKNNVWEMTKVFYREWGNYIHLCK